MPDYPRNRVPGGTYFFTLNLRDRRDGSLVVHVASLRATVRKVRQRQTFHIDSWIVLQDLISKGLVDLLSGRNIMDRGIYLRSRKFAKIDKFPE